MKSRRLDPRSRCSLLTDARGLTGLEYVMLACLIAVICLVAWRGFGETIEGKVGGVDTMMASLPGGEGGPGAGGGAGGVGSAAAGLGSAAGPRSGSMPAGGEGGAVGTGSSLMPTASSTGAAGSAATPASAPPLSWEVVGRGLRALTYGPLVDSVQRKVDRVGREIDTLPRSGRGASGSWGTPESTGSSSSSSSTPSSGSSTPEP